MDASRPLVEPWKEAEKEQPVRTLYARKGFRPLRTSSGPPGHGSPAEHFTHCTEPTALKSVVESTGVHPKCGVCVDNSPASTLEAVASPCTARRSAI